MSRPTDKRVLAGAVLVLIAALAGPQRAAAIGDAPCDEPFLFRNAAVNAVVLPFRSSDPERRRLSDTGRSLATLVQLEVLMSLIKYRSVGAVVLHENEPQGCDAINVLEKLQDQLQPQLGLILVWGRIYEQEDQVYVQTYARFLGGARNEEFEFTLTDEEDRKYSFKAPLPFTSMAFAPRRLSQDDVGQIEREFLTATVVRPRPDPDAAGEALHRDPGSPFAYTVAEVREGWIHIVERNGSRQGWIRARDDFAWPLRRKMPELSLIDAIAGYLRIRAAEAENMLSAPQATAAHVQHAIETYRELSGSAEEPDAAAAASMLDGLVALRQTPSLASAVERAESRFARAAGEAPYSTAARNLAAMPSILRYGRVSDDPEDARTAVDLLLAALSLDPGNDAALANLENFYAYLRQVPAESPPFPPDDLALRWEQVKAVRRRVD